MKRLLAGVAIGVAITSSSVAIGGALDIRIPPGSRAVVQPGTKYSTLVRFPGLDLSCTYARAKAPIPGLEPAGGPLMFCSRSSVPGSNDPQQPQSRLIVVSRFRYFVTDNHGNVVYKVLRAP